MLSFALLISFEVVRFAFAFIAVSLVVGVVVVAHLLFSSLLFDLSLRILRATHSMLSVKKINRKELKKKNKKQICIREGSISYC